MTGFFWATSILSQCHSLRYSKGMFNAHTYICITYQEGRVGQETISPPWTHVTFAPTYYTGPHLKWEHEARMCLVHSQLHGDVAETAASHPSYTRPGAKTTPLQGAQRIERIVCQ